MAFRVLVCPTAPAISATSRTSWMNADADTSAPLDSGAPAGGNQSTRQHQDTFGRGISGQQEETKREIVCWRRGEVQHITLAKAFALQDNTAREVRRQVINRVATVASGGGRVTGQRLNLTAILL